MKGIMEDISNKYNKLIENGFEPKYIVMGTNDYRRLCTGYFGNPVNEVFGLPVVLVPHYIEITVVTDATLEYGYDVRN